MWAGQPAAAARYGGKDYDEDATTLLINNRINLVLYKFGYEGRG